ncbi:hypothetical protein [Zhongshania sp.]|jgi:hypothetical protein|uniref:hypothetical protein n=1 Tax=Zhongshania sp. TaxID=1971902 RepID=UPI0039E4CFC2
MKVLFRSCLLMFTAFLFAGCGGGSDGTPSLTPPDGNSTGNNTIKLGSTSGGSFAEGLVRAVFTNLSQGDTTGLSVALVDANNIPFTDPANVIFTSTCISAGLSTAAPASINNTNGLIETNYTSNSCNGEDLVVASTTVNGETLFASTVLTTSLTTHFGSFSGGIFIDGRIQAGQTGTNKLIVKNGETANLKVELRNSSDVLISDAIKIGFSSDCLEQGLASITPSSVTNSNGTITAAYTGNGCVGEDVIIAQTRYGSETLTATATVSVDTPDVRFGSYTGNNFSEGVLKASAAIDNDGLAPGESVTLTASLIDQDNDLYLGSSDVFFTSTCIAAGTAEIDPVVVNTTTGQISAVYTARGCTTPTGGPDGITATTSVSGATLTTSVNIKTEPAVVGGLQFISATPRIIRLAGTGGPDRDSQSTVIFQVNDANGTPLPQQTVNFVINHGEPLAQNGNIGDDAFLSVYTAISDAVGRVKTIVNAGTVAIPIRVSATFTESGTGTQKSAVSSSLAITTGIPDSNSFSISAEILNIEGNNFDGETTAITARAADRYNNPVLDGTAINFITEGGAIGSVNGAPEESPAGTCFTLNGVCSVLLSSQQPKPSDGNVTVLAYAVGEESFEDEDANGRHDDGELTFHVVEPFVDAEAIPSSSSRDIDIAGGDFDQYIDTNGNGQWDTQNTTYEGLLCSGAECGTSNTTLVSRDIIIVFGASSFDVTVTNVILNGSDGVVTVTIQDKAGRNKLPAAGTTLSVSSSFGTILNGNETIADSNSDGPISYAFFVRQAANPGSGTITATVTTPNSIKSQGTSSIQQL